MERAAKEDREHKTALQAHHMKSKSIHVEESREDEGPSEVIQSLMGRPEAQHHFLNFVGRCFTERGEVETRKGRVRRNLLKA